MTTETKQGEILNRYLPKWPQLLMYGEKVTVEQADEIIRRTDSFFHYMEFYNDMDHAAAVFEIVGAPAFVPRNPDHTKDIEAMQKRWADIDKFKEKWDYIHTEYIHNDWIQSSYIGGANGWCHPDGTIRHTKNVGKYPSGQEIFNELSTLCGIFPFVKAEAVLMDGESCTDGIKPVIGYKMQDGKVWVYDPISEPMWQHCKAHNHVDATIEDMVGRLVSGRLGSDNAISYSTIRRWAERMGVGTK